MQAKVELFWIGQGWRYCGRRPRWKGLEVEDELELISHLRSRQRVVPCAWNTFTFKCKGLILWLSIKCHACLDVSSQTGLC